MTVDSYILFLLGLGAVVLLVSWAPIGLRRLPFSLAMVCVILGFLLFNARLLSFDPNPRTYDTLIERMSELALIVALMGAGLKLDRPFGWRSWSNTWRLLGIAMPLTIVAIAWLGWVGFGFSLAMSMLLGAALAPTDPVLAAEVQVGPPRSGDNDEVRFSLTSEAGFNDALAFPFVHLAILLSVAATASSVPIGDWFASDVGWRLGAGGLVGYLAGLVFGRLVFSSRRFSLSNAGDGLVVLAATLLTYAACELVHGYGFLGVFICGLTIRSAERSHEFHEVMHQFADQLERLLMMLLLVLLGGAIARGVLSSLSWSDVLLSVLILFVVRPISAWVALIGSGVPSSDRLLIAFFGIRGLGTIYYAAYAINHGSFGNSERLWAVISVIVLLSIFVHGVAASLLMRRRES